MKGTDRPKQPLTALVELAKQRLSEALKDYIHDDRPWYVRQLLSKSHAAKPPVQWVIARWYADIDLARRACAGSMLGCWLIGDDRVTYLDEFIDEPPKPKPDGLVNPLKATLFNFGTDEFDRKCVVVEVTMDGLIRRAAYELPDGIHTEIFGTPIGRLVEERIDRKLWNPFLADGGISQR